MAKKNKGKRSKKETEKRRERELEGGAGGAIAGAAAGAIAGPPGAAAGAVIGAIAGALAGAAIDKTEDSHAAEERKLDREIGVSEGELGAPNLEHPPAKIGAYSGASVGVGASDEDSPAEGPMQAPK
jgi:hypothetical protein